jgi:hypothetical protein
MTRPLPPAAREALLAFLAAVYPAEAAQAQMRDASDSSVAWQCQSALDDYAEYEPLKADGNRQ